MNHIAALKQRISTARIVSPEDILRNVVTTNSRVGLQDMDSGKRLMLTLADPFDASMFGDRLSVAGPCGAALPGKRSARSSTGPWARRPVGSGLDK